jgi:hypothetical protein
MLLYFYGHLDYFTAIWHTLWPFGIVCGHLAYFYILVCLEQEKSGNPAAILSAVNCPDKLSKVRKENREIFDPVLCCRNNKSVQNVCTRHCQSARLTR